MAKQGAANLPPLEQCSLCSTHYLRPANTYVQPVLNRQIGRLLDINVSESQAFFNKYVPVCEECTTKVKRFEKLRIELDIVRSETVSSVLDTLLHIRSDESTPLDAVKNSIIERWNNPQPRHQTKGSALPNASASKTTTNGIKKNSTVVNNSPVKEFPVTVAEISEANIATWAVAEDYYVESVEAVVEVETTDNYDGMGSPAGDMDDDGGSDSDFNQECDTGELNEDKKSLLKHLALTNPKRYRKMVQADTNVDCQNNPPPFFCDNCGRTYSSYKNAMIHMRTCQEDPEKHLKICVFCFADFSSGSWYQLKLHYDSDHPGTFLQKCPRCRRELLPGMLDDHLCGGAIIKPIEKMECELCNLSYNTPDTLQKHVMRRHKDLFTNGTTLNCEFCDKKFVLKSMLDRHLRVHQRVTESKWQCDICHIFLSTRTGLKQHKTKHTGEMPFECDVCHKKFRMSSVLRCHKVTHTKEKNHECTICGEKFSLYSIMYRHWKRHKMPAGDGIYKCPIVSCFRLRFRRVYALKDHMKAHHPYTSECEEVLTRYKNVDDRSVSRIKRERKPRKPKVRTKRTPIKSKSSGKLGKYSESEDENIEEDERNEEQEDDIGSDDQNQEDVKGSITPYKRSARLAAKASTKRKSKSKVQIKKEKSPNKSAVEKKIRPGPKSRTMKLEKSIVPETTEENDDNDVSAEDNDVEENGISAEEHSDLIIIKEEPVDNADVSDNEGEGIDNSLTS